MPRSLPPLNALRAFEAAGRHGSFTRTTTELSVSHSAISRHGRGLEKRLNVHLFRVKNTGLALVDQGQACLAEITPAFDQISDATERLLVPPKGVVTPTTEGTIAQKWFVPRRTSLTAHRPDIEPHDFDIGPRFLRSEPPDGYDLVLPTNIRACAAPEFAPIKDRTPDLLALANGSLIDEATFRFWPDWFRQAGLKDVPELDLPHPPGALLAIQSAVAGLGAVLTDKCLCQPELKSGALVERSQVELPFGGCFLAINRKAGRRKAVRAVGLWLLAECAIFTAT